MNLTVEWVSKHSLNKEPWKDLQEIPVIRIDALRRWLVETRDKELRLLGRTQYAVALIDLLAQLPEEG